MVAQILIQEIEQDFTDFFFNDCCILYKPWPGQSEQKNIPVTVNADINHIIVKTCFSGPSQSAACTSPVSLFYLNTNMIRSELNG